MQEVAPADTASGPALPHPKPFLRRGAGWEARIAAAREGRRYVPRGGAVKDYSQESEAPLPHPRRPDGGKAARPSGGARKAVGPANAGQAAAAAHHRPAAARAGRCVPPSAEQAPHAPVAATAGWARRLQQQQSGMQQHAAVPARSAHDPVQVARQAEEAAALKEFEALESQVLREVHTNSPLLHGSGSRKLQARGTSAVQRQPACEAPLPAEAQSADGGENWGAVHEEDVFASDGEGSGVCGLFGEGSQAHAPALGLSHRAISFGSSSVRSAPYAAPLGAPVPQGLPPVYCDEEYEGEMHAESSFQDLPHQPASKLVQQFFSRPALAAPAPDQAAAHAPRPQRAAGTATAPGDPTYASAAEDEALEQLQQEVVALQQERAKVSRLRLELEEAAARLEEDKAAFQKQKLEHAARFETERTEELRKLQRDRRVLEKQSRAILKLPTKQSKEEVAAVEALLAEERRAARAREARHKLTVERLRQQLVELQDKNSELREQVLCLEQQRLAAAWGEVAAGAPAAAAAAAAGTAAPLPRQGAGSPSAASRPRTGGAADLQSSSRAGRLGGLPSVRVERWGSGTSVARLAAGPSATLRPGQQQQLQHSRDQPPSGSAAAVGAAVDGGVLQEAAIADVELCDAEEMVMWSEQQDGEQPAALEWAGEQPADPDAAAPAAAGPNTAPRGPGLAPQSGMPGTSAANCSSPAEAAAAVAATDAISKAGSALARFNQLRSSLALDDSIQGRLASSNACLQPSPPAVPTSAVATPQPVVGTAAAPPASTAVAEPLSAATQQDDLRRLGCTLLAAAPASGAEPLCRPLYQPLGVPAVAPQPFGTQAALLPATAATSSDPVVSEVQHPDGRLEQLFASGAREQRFVNGSAKHTLPSGASLTRFTNGDVKKVLLGGTIEYYFAEVASWQVTHPSGVDVFFFPSGQVEAHHPGGVKELLFPDGAVRKLLPDGRELAISAAHLSPEIQAAQPVAALH